MSAGKRYNILSTKAIPADLLAMAADQGIDITVQPFINIRPVINDILKEKIHKLFQQKIVAVFTSSNAVRALYDYHPDPDWAIYCLEGATKDALTFRYTLSGTAPNAAALAQEIITQGKTTAVVFFCGNKRRGELPDLLRQHGITVEEVEVYETTETPAITTATYDGIFFLSPSAVSSFFTVNRLPENTVCFTIGHTTAQALEDFTGNKIIVSTEPQLRDMVQTAIFYFNNINCYE